MSLIPVQPLEAETHSYRSVNTHWLQALRSSSDGQRQGHLSNSVRSHEQAVTNVQRPPSFSTEPALVEFPPIHPRPLSPNCPPPLPRPALPQTLPHLPYRPIIFQYPLLHQQFDHALHPEPASYAAAVEAVAVVPRGEDLVQDRCSCAAGFCCGWERGRGRGRGRGRERGRWCQGEGFDHSPPLRARGR